ncbi:hypothetical protein [Marinifilum fragile]|uniref:hypothetical protein n=1 Tax=Marinifilum fragile TaxID=570161 RepID=UPI002AAC05AC|nr:hypothetical protein [Marinifilum fragile]
MKNIIITLSIILLLCNTHLLSAQSSRINFNVGYGTYKLENQKDILEQAQVYDSKTLTSFPGNVYYSGSLEFLIKKNHLLGFNMMYLYTGGRNHIRDYSGEYKLDIQVNAIRFGGGYKTRIFENATQKLRLDLGLNVGIIWSDFNATETLAIYNYDSDSMDVSYKYAAPFAEPQLTLSYLLGKGLYITGNLGYELDINHQIGWFDSDEYKRGIRTDWSGLRASVGFSYVI